MSQPKLLDQMRHKMRLHQYSPDTERAYIYWARRFILFHKKSHPKEMGKKEVEAFLTHLAVIRGVAPSTQNLALSSILFLYQKVMEIELSWLDATVSAGWFRTGSQGSFVAGIGNPRLNCTDWTSDSSEESGTVFFFSNYDFPLDDGNPDNNENNAIDHMQMLNVACDTVQKVWCVED